MAELLLGLRLADLSFSHCACVDPNCVGADGLKAHGWSAGLTESFVKCSTRHMALASSRSAHVADGCYDLLSMQGLESVQSQEWSGDRCMGILL